MTLDRPKRAGMLLVPLAVSVTAILVDVLVPSLTTPFHRINYDLDFRHARRAPAIDKRLMFLMVDDRTLRDFQEYPLKRSTHARLLHGLAGTGASATAWDFIFDRKTVDDDAFASAMAEVPTLLALGARRIAPDQPRGTPSGEEVLRRFAVGPTAVLADRRKIPEMVLTVESEPALLAAARGGGQVASTVDVDGICRRVPPLVTVDGHLIPSLGFAAALHLLGVPPEDVVPMPGSITVGAKTLASPITIPLDRHGNLLLDYSADWTRDIDARSYSGQLKALDEFPGDEDLKKAFGGRLVLVGSTASGSGDFVATPGEPLLPGALVTFTLANMILTRQFLSEVGTIWVWALTLLLPLALGSLFALERPRLAGFAGVAFAGLLLGASPAIFWSSSKFLPVALPLLATVLTASLLATLSHAREHARATRVASMLARFVSPALTRELDARGGKSRLPAARRVELTVLFVDIAGFTPFTEEKEPEEVSTFLEVFYQLAMEELFRHKGTLDEFKGDGVLAYFGAPEAVPDKETLAVKAAAAIRDRVALLNTERRARGQEQLGIRCGVTTGFVAVGYFGGESHATYGVVGRAVNLAARLQSHAESGQILVDKPTAARLDAAIGKTELDPITLKGIAKPVEVWRVADPPSINPR